MARPEFASGLPVADVNPEGFLWGAATASYQIEGGRAERGDCIWDSFCRVPGKVRNGDTGDVACDHYHRSAEDVRLMRDLGLQAYRFSISWPRVIPGGRGPVSAAGLDFYDRLVDDLLDAGIVPMVTLYHWDLPQELEDAGGWPNLEVVDWYTEYAQAVVRRLGDRVNLWITHNEPWVAAWLGYGYGIHAPGRHSQAEALAATHHFLLSHGRVVNMVHAEVPDARVGITLNFSPVYAESDTAADRGAARQADGTAHRWFLDPLFRGQYPADISPLYEGDMPDIRAGDLETISTPMDFLGVNSYSRRMVRADPVTGRPVTVRPVGEYTAMDWEVYPDALRDLLLRLHRDYAPPQLYVTENGAAYQDVRRHDGEVLDPERTDYLEQHVAVVRQAMGQGAPVAGYFAWSLLDNFEWAHGYVKRFGLVYIDYPSLVRIPKASARWYRDFIQSQP